MVPFFKLNIEDFATINHISLTSRTKKGVIFQILQASAGSHLFHKDVPQTYIRSLRCNVLTFCHKRKIFLYNAVLLRRMQPIIVNKIPVAPLLFSLAIIIPGTLPWLSKCRPNGDFAWHKIKANDRKILPSVPIGHRTAMRAPPCNMYFITSWLLFIF